MHRLIEILHFNIVIAGLSRSDAASAAELKIRHINPSACRLLGFPADRLVGKSLDMISAPEFQSGFWESALRRTQSQKDAGFHEECELIDSRGSRIPVMVSFSLLPDSGGDSDELILFVQDIGDKKAREKKLLMMHTAVEQSASAVMITSARGAIEYVNPKFTELTGYSAQEVLGKNPRILKSEDTAPEQHHYMWKQLLETGEWRGEIKDKKKNGENYWAYESISAIKNSAGEITHFLAVEEDITQRKLAETALSESEERFRQMAEMTGEWLWEQSPEGYYLYSSVAVAEILGYAPEEVIGKHYTEFLTPLDKQQQQPYSSLSSPFYSLTNRYMHRNGKQIITESTGLPIKDGEGKVIKWRGVDRDITARKHFEDALIDSEKRNRLIVESALNAIVLMDSYGIVTDWNHQAVQMFGWKEEEALGRRLDELIIPERYRAAHRKGLENFLHTGTGPILNKRIEHTALRADGSEFPVEISISPLKLGNSYIFSGFIHDISSRKKAEKDIRQAQVNLAIARNEMKIAYQIQSSLLPDGPITAEKYLVTGYCLPADQVGGDYYDYFTRGEDRLDMVIADVSGHSVGPALFMVETRSAIRTQANWSATPSETLSILNDFLFVDLDKADFFITMFYLQYHVGSGRLFYANAGHPSPLLIHHKNNNCALLDADGLIIGVRDKVVFEEKSIELSRGDMVLMYTDGLIEAENPDGEFFGVGRIVEVFNRCAECEPQVIVGEIMESLRSFSRADRFNDDITLLIFKVK
ncbi:MAG: PAS domain S-box protein [Gammaproteobacteria bacterium]